MSCVKRYPFHDNRGFTLVELLVVMIIVGIMAAMAVLRVGGNSQRELQAEARRLQTVLRAAADEALLQGREFGCLLERDGYQVLIFDYQARQWQPTESKTFARYRLPDGITLSYELEGEAVELREIDQQQPGAAAPEVTANEQVPKLIFFSSGEMVPFRINLQLQNGEAELLLHSDGVADVQIGVKGG